MKISFIIPAYNEEHWIGDCLRTIADLRDPWIHEIIVVDNCSTDGTERAAAAFQNVTVLREEKKGVTKARQKGLEHATGELIATIDADTRISLAWLSVVKNRFTAEPDLVCLVGPYDYYDVSYWKRSIVRTLRGVFRIAKALSGKKQLFAQGGNTVYAADALRRAGGFSTAIQYYGEDLDLLRRMQKVGKVDLDRRMVAMTSGRRMNAEGFWKVIFGNKVNAVWQNVTGSPLFRGTEKDWR